MLGGHRRIAGLHPKCRPSSGRFLDYLASRVQDASRLRHLLDPSRETAITEQEGVWLWRSDSWPMAWRARRQASCGTGSGSGSPIWGILPRAVSDISNLACPSRSTCQGVAPAVAGGISRQDARPNGPSRHGGGKRRRPGPGVCVSLIVDNISVNQGLRRAGVRRRACSRQRASSADAPRRTARSGRPTRPSRTASAAPCRRRQSPAAAAPVSGSRGWDGDSFVTRWASARFPSPGHRAFDLAMI